MNKPPQILELEKHLGFELTETKNPEYIFDWKVQKAYLLNDSQEVIGLSLSNCKLKSISFLQGLTQLQSIDLFNNQISDISFLRGLTQLQYLILETNQISDISFLQVLTKLQLLNLRYNQISDISFLQGLTQLQSLDLEDNQVSDYSFLQNLTQLQSLDLSNNQISDYSFLQGLTQLQSIVLLNNQISDYSFLQDLSQLKSLNLESNQITNISLSWLNSFPNLEELYLEGNPIQNIPTEIFDINENVLPEVRHYLEGIARDEEVGKITYNREMKMILVGNGGVGKTQTANRLAEGEAFVFNTQHDSTHGIVQMPYHLGDVLFHLWDFAGQDIYHATHRLFLQTRALFVLVWDYENEFEKTYHEYKGVPYKNENLEYWLQYIQCFGKDSQVLLVQNKIDLHHAQALHSQDIKALQARYPILEVLRVSAETGEGFDELAYYVEEAIADNPIFKQHFQQRMVSNWAEVRQALRDRRAKGEKLMTKDDFVALCAKYKTEESASTLLAYLHDTGEVYYRVGYFGDNIILNQDWAIQAIYQVLDRTKTHSKIIRNKKGNLDYAMLAKIWKDNTDSERELFIDFMLSAELCFEVTEDKKYGTPFQARAFVIPQLLPEKNAEISYEIGKVQARHTEKIEYPFLPTVFMDRFIVQASKLSTENYRWAGGILLDTNEGKAVVEADYKQKCINITAESPRLLEVIKGVLYNITQEGKIKNDSDCFGETKRMWTTFEENKIFRKEDTLNPNIEKALTCLQNADYAGYFEEMDKVEMPKESQNPYATNKSIYYSGQPIPHDFAQKLEVFAKDVNRAL